MAKKAKAKKAEKKRGARYRAFKTTVVPDRPGSLALGLEARLVVAALRAYGADATARPRSRRHHRRGTKPLDEVTVKTASRRSLVAARLRGGCPK